ncbi:MAG: hypothetical protein ACRDTD_05795, partial [Pseudonocardiaceae bacterium]
MPDVRGADGQAGTRAAEEGEQRTQALRRGVAGAGQVVINPCGQLPATSVNPVSGPGLELVTSLVLLRVHGGGYTKLDATLQLSTQALDWLSNHSL